MRRLGVGPQIADDCTRLWGCAQAGGVKMTAPPGGDHKAFNNLHGPPFVNGRSATKVSAPHYTGVALSGPSDAIHD